MTAIRLASPPEFATAKANFEQIYAQPDPRSYVEVLGGLDYAISEIASPVFLQLIRHLSAKLKRPVHILDLGCSYGFNSAMLRLGLNFDMLRERYRGPAIRALSPDDVISADRKYFSSWPPVLPMSIVGLDVSRPAIDYAATVGLIDSGIALDLENDDLRPMTAKLVSRADLIISTGCVGYVTARSFAKLMACYPADRKPWVASFALRMFPYGAIAATLETKGLVTEKFEGATFMQRRFRNRAEQTAAMADLARQGVDPSGKESAGFLHAEFFLSRPPRDVVANPLNQLVSISSGLTPRRQALAAAR